MATGSNRYRQRLQPALDYIRAHLNEPLPLESLAGMSHFSKFHFHRVFKAVLNETVHGHVRRLRLERSLQRLRSASGQSIADLSLASGYSSQSAFNRDFKCHFGITPGQARRAKAKAPQSSCTNQPHVPAEISLATITIQRIPEMHLACRTRHGAYDLRLGWTWMRLIGRVRAQGLLGRDSRKLGIIYDDPEVTVAAQCRFDAAINVPPGPATRYFAPLECAVLDFQAGFGLIGAALDAVYAHWLLDSDYEPADHPPLMYFNGPLHEYRRFQLCVPISKIVQ